MGVATVVVARMLLSQCSSTSSVVTTSHLYIHPPSRGLVRHVMVLLEHAQASVLTPFTHTSNMLQDRTLPQSIVLASDVYQPGMVLM